MVFFLCLCYNHFRCAGMAELADAHGSGPCARKGMEVRVFLPAPNKRTGFIIIPRLFCLVIL